MAEKFRKKPVEIEALQFDGGNAGDIELFVGDTYETWLPSTNQIEIRTLEGPLTASKGDWIIKGVKGEFYPCKPDIFEATYDKVDP